MDSSLTIGMPISSFLPSIGGAEIGLHNIATRLTERGHKPIIITSWRHCRALSTAGWQLPYPVVAFPPKMWGLLHYAPTVAFVMLDNLFARVNRRFKVDVWHATIGYPSGVALAHFAYKRNIPNLVRCVGEDIQIDKTIDYGMRLNSKIDSKLRHWLPKASRLVAISESVAGEYRLMGVPNKKIAYIPNGVNLERFSNASSRADTRKKYGISPESFLYLCVGRNHPKKNYNLLLQAFASLSLDCVELAIIGKGATDLAATTQALKIADRVHLVETLYKNRTTKNKLDLPSDELVKLYQSSDVFVFPSRLETFGIVLVEAMAAGLPVITTNAPGCRDVVRGGKDGITVDVDNMAALLSAMRQLRENEILRNQFSRASRNRAAAFSWDGVTTAYLTLYREMIREHSQNKITNK